MLQYFLKHINLSSLHDNKNGQICASLALLKDMLSASGGKAPDSLTRGSAPGLCWGPAPNPCYRLTLRSRHGPPTFMTKFMPMQNTQSAFGSDADGSWHHSWHISLHRDWWIITLNRCTLNRLLLITTMTPVNTHLHTGLSYPHWHLTWGGRSEHDLSEVCQGRCSIKYLTVPNSSQLRHCACAISQSLVRHCLFNIYFFAYVAYVMFR